MLVMYAPQSKGLVWSPLVLLLFSVEVSVVLYYNLSVVVTESIPKKHSGLIPG